MTAQGDRIGWRRPAFAAPLLAAFVFAQSPARAQSVSPFALPQVRGLGTEPDVTVLSRLRPDYDPVGVRFGPTTIHAQADAAPGYDSNVRGIPRGQGSPLLFTRGTVDSQSTWQSDTLSAALDVDDTRYFDQPSQSLTNWDASLAASHAIGRDLISAEYLHQNLNQTARDLNTPRLESPAAYRVDTVRLDYKALLSRVTLEPDLGVSLYSFDDGSVAGAPYPQRYRDRTVIAPGLTARYSLADRREILVEVRDAIADYRRPTDPTQKRDYNDVSALAGLDWDDGKLRLRGLAGYETRSFSNAVFKTIEAPIAEFTGIWNPSGRQTVTATVSRRIADSADETVTGFTETALRASYDREVARNILFRLQGGYFIDDYSRGLGSQTLYTGGGGVTWLLNRTLRLAASYDYTSRRSAPRTTTSGLLGLGTGQPFGPSYEEHHVLLRLSVAL